MNSIIINEFSKLVTFIQYQINELEKDTSKDNAKNIVSYNFRLRQIKNILLILKKYNEEITIDNINELAQVNGIGKGTIERVKEILVNKKLSELDDFNKIYNNSKFKNENKIIDELSEIVGVGPVKAKEFFKTGIKSVHDLKTKIDKGTLEVNDKIILGLKYHDVYKINIPRKEIDKIYKLLEKVVSSVNKKYKLDDDNKYIFEICGSYRREKPFSNDIDILLSKLGDTNTDLAQEENNLKMFVNTLKSNIRSNNNKPLLLDDITDKNIETKYMGFGKYKDEPIRRIDIRYVNFNHFYYALLYFTGSSDLNKKMRELAKTKGLKLSEYGLVDSKNKNYNVKSERDIFKKLGLEYLPPILR
jgi:DNA polymerase/3'-5' exonuclease PolX